MLDRSCIGAASGERSIAVEAGQVRLFCEAIGETDPIFLDAAAARAAGYPAIPVPPTFASALDNLAPQDSDLILDLLKANLGRLLHGEQRFEHHHPIYVGDQVRLTKRIADIYDKKNGALEFVVLETEVRNQHDRLCATLRSVAVLRN